MNVIHSSDKRLWQGVQLGFHTEVSESMAFDAILTLLRTRRISFLGLTGTGLDDAAGERLADALAFTPARAINQVSLKPERLDLTQIAFGPKVRARLQRGGTEGRRTLLSCARNKYLHSQASGALELV